MLRVKPREMMHWQAVKTEDEMVRRLRVDIREDALGPGSYELRLVIERRQKCEQMFAAKLSCITTRFDYRSFETRFGVLRIERQDDDSRHVSRCQFLKRRPNRRIPITHAKLDDIFIKVESRGDLVRQRARVYQQGRT